MSSENWTTALTFKLPWEFHQPKQPEQSYDVPAQIHFIWYGSDAPDEVQHNVTRCQELNPDWQVTLWSDRPQPHVRVPVKLFTDQAWPQQQLVTLFQDHLGVLGDILRYQIIYTHGGMYLDADVTCLRPFTEPMFRQSFVCAELTQYKNLCNSAFAFPAQSACLQYVMACLEENLAAHRPLSVVRLAGPLFFTTCLQQYGDARIQNIPQQVMLGHVRAPTDSRPLYAKERLAAAWTAHQPDLSKYYQQLFHEPAPSVSIPEPA